MKRRNRKPRASRWKCSASPTSHTLKPNIRRPSPVLYLPVGIAAHANSLFLAVKSRSNARPARLISRFAAGIDGCILGARRAADSDDPKGFCPSRQQCVPAKAARAAAGLSFARACPRPRRGARAVAKEVARIAFHPNDALQRTARGPRSSRGRRLENGPRRSTPYRRAVHLRTMHPRTMHPRTMSSRTMHPRTMHQGTMVLKTMVSPIAGSLA